MSRPTGTALGHVVPHDPVALLRHPGQFFSPRAWVDAPGPGNKLQFVAQRLQFLMVGLRFLETSDVRRRPQRRRARIDRLGSSVIVRPSFAAAIGRPRSSIGCQPKRDMPSSRALIPGSGPSYSAGRKSLAW
jgi:hypothetical protein